MENSAQKCARILSALEDLAGQETAALQSGHFAAAAEILSRAAPLIDFLAGDGTAALDRTLRERLRCVAELRARNSAWLARELARTRDELRHTQAAERRVSRVAPVYGGAATATRASSQMSLVG